MKQFSILLLIVGMILMSCSTAKQLSDTNKVMTDQTAPQIAVTIPGSESALSGSVNLDIAIADESEIAAIAILMDGESVVTLNGDASTYLLNTANFTNGSHSLIIIVTDAAGNTAQIEESINIDNPTTGTVSGVINGTATVTINQVDGTTQTAATSSANPEYIFENVPQGETTLVYEAGGTTTTQTVQVNPGVTTAVNAFGSTQELINSLKVTVHDQPIHNSNARVETLGTELMGEPFYTREINVPTRSFTEGFPGVTDKFEWFGLIYEGKITAPVSGEYTFWVTCDDGGALYVNGNMVVDGNYVHAPTTFSGKVNLNAGEIYDFMVKYFQGPKYHIALVVEVQFPGGERKLFNMSDFK